jgi:hypothetical protein
MRKVRDNIHRIGLPLHRKGGVTQGITVQPDQAGGLGSANSGQAHKPQEKE